MQGEQQSGDPDPPEPAGPFDIYETADGPRHVEHAVRRRLLAMMRGRERTVPEMIALTGLGKSTVSAHLSQLAREGLLDYREDPRDRRCKLYYLTSRHFATAGPSRDRPELVDSHEDGPAIRSGGLARILLRTLLAELACSGLDLDPVVREAGRRVGEAVGRERPARDLAEWCASVERFWQEADLGRLSFTQSDPPHVVVESCSLCVHSPRASLRLCTIVAGLLEGMASESLGSLVEAQHVGASSHEDGCACSFELVIVAGPPLI